MQTPDIMAVGDIIHSKSGIWIRFPFGTTISGNLLTEIQNRDAMTNNFVPVGISIPTPVLGALNANTWYWIAADRSHAITNTRQHKIIAALIITHSSGQGIFASPGIQHVYSVRLPDPGAGTGVGGG